MASVSVVVEATAVLGAFPLSAPPSTLLPPQDTPPRAISTPAMATQMFENFIAFLLAERNR
ncbi:MAG: hypothetical protein OEW90_10800, partial [Betaproteobacteria bacterium]|nr:hypothetical protein [Betaproteobacteria bacterium]